MQHSVLPSSHRKIGSDQSFRDDELLQPEKVGGKKISPTALARASQCLLRGLLAATGVKGIGVSPFTEATFADGKEYEAKLIHDEIKSIWIQVLNQSLGEKLPVNLPIRKGVGLKRGENESAHDFAHRAKTQLNKTISSAGEAPYAIHEPNLAVNEAGVPLQGKPDLLIWTGDRWIIADIKCSEAGKRSHGIQIAAYNRMLSAMRPGDKVDPRGVVIHCSPGYRYSKDSLEEVKEQCLQHTVATPFPIESLQPEADALIAALRDASTNTITEAERIAVFTPICNECEYRMRCYPRFLRDQHVSLLPFMQAELEAVVGAGMISIEDVARALTSGNGQQYDTLLDLKEGSRLQIRFLRQKVEKVKNSGIYSSWRASPNATETPLFFVSNGVDFLFEPALDDAENPSCLVVYTEAERRRAWAKIFSEGKDWKHVEVFILSEDLQQTLHGPIPSLTLRPLAAFLGWVGDGRPLSEFEGWLEQNFTGDLKEFDAALEESPDPAQRLAQLKIVWNYLQSAAIPFTIP